MITVDNHEWKALAEKIMVGDKQIVAVYAGSKKVYPDEEPVSLFIAMWFILSQYVEPRYSQTLVNQYGLYLKYEPDEKAFYRVAIYVDKTSNPYKCIVYATMNNFSQAKHTLLSVAYVADDGTIVYDGATGQLNSYQLSSYTSSSGKTYYKTSKYSLNIRDAENKYLQRFIDSSDTSNCELFYNGSNAYLYVIDEMAHRYAETYEEGAQQLIDGGFPDPSASPVTIYVSYDIFSSAKIFYNTACDMLQIDRDAFNVSMSPSFDDMGEIMITYTYSPK